MNNPICITRSRTLNRSAFSTHRYMLKRLAAKRTHITTAECRIFLESQCQCSGKCRSLFMKNMKSIEKDAEENKMREHIAVVMNKIERTSFVIWCAHGCVCSLD